VKDFSKSPPTRDEIKLLARSIVDAEFTIVSHALLRTFGFVVRQLDVHPAARLTKESLISEVERLLTSWLLERGVNPQG